MPFAVEDCFQLLADVWIFGTRIQFKSFLRSKEEAQIVDKVWS